MGANKGFKRLRFCFKSARLVASDMVRDRVSHTGVGIAEKDFRPGVIDFGNVPCQSQPPGMQIIQAVACVWRVSCNYNALKSLGTDSDDECPWVSVNDREGSV